jgi:hypothetical protein
LEKRQVKVEANYAINKEDVVKAEKKGRDYRSDRYPFAAGQERLYRAE